MARRVGSIHVEVSREAPDDGQFLFIGVEEEPRNRPKRPPESPRTNDTGGTVLNYPAEQYFDIRGPGPRRRRMPAPIVRYD